MTRTIKTIVTLLLLSILATSVMQFSNIKTVNAINGSVIYGIPGVMTANEAGNTTDGCAAIRYYFSLTGNYIYLENYCGVNTQNTYVYSVANYLETYNDVGYDFATAFYKGDSIWLQPGHRLNPQPPNNYNHSVLYSNDGSADNELIWDKEIGSRTVNGRHDFVFLWTCGMANEAQIGGMDGSNTWGMAYSWLKRNNLNLDGYNQADGSDHCYIGFQYYSKPFADYTGRYSYNYKIFATMFYYLALNVDGYTIKDALDEAALTYIGYELGQTQLFQGYPDPEGLGLTCKIRVWGDSGMTLP
jgi:hypothetical protein